MFFLAIHSYIVASYFGNAMLLLQVL